MIQKKQLRRGYPLFVGLLLLAVGMSASAQERSDTLHYKIEAGGGIGKGDYTPFWLTANKHGFASVHKNYAYLRAATFYASDASKDFHVEAGLDMAVAYNFDASYYLQQAYADLNYRCLQLSIGSKERWSELNNPLLSSGGLTHSGNARPIPQVRAGIPEYQPFPGTNKWLKVKGYISYGMFTDDAFQKDFIGGKGKRAEKVLYHSKEIFFQIGKKERYPFILDLGLEMAAQFSGRTYVNEKLKLDMMADAKDFYRVLIASGAGSDKPQGEQLNVLGNYVGSWNFGLTWYAPNGWTIRPYYEHFFDDHSQMFWDHQQHFWDYTWKDGLIGLEVKLPKNPFVSNFVYEYLGMKDQSGAVYWDQTKEIPISVAGNDNYYNHGFLCGWHHAGMGIGNPLIISPLFNKDKTLTFTGTRTLSHHIGLMGDPHPQWQYRLLLSTSRSWGTYGNPYDDIEQYTNGMLEVGYKPSNWGHGWMLKAAVAIDKTDRYGNNIGGLFSITKKGLLTQ